MPKDLKHKRHWIKNIARIQRTRKLVAEGDLGKAMIEMSSLEIPDKRTGVGKVVDNTGSAEHQGALAKITENETRVKEYTEKLRKLQAPENIGNYTPQSQTDMYRSAMAEYKSVQDNATVDENGNYDEMTKNHLKSLSHTMDKTKSGKPGDADYKPPIAELNKQIKETQESLSAWRSSIDFSKQQAKDSETKTIYDTRRGRIHAPVDKADFTSEAFLNHKEEVIKRTKFPAFDDKLNKITKKSTRNDRIILSKALRKHIDNNVADTLDRLAKGLEPLGGEGIALAKQSVAKAQTASGTGAGETHIQGLPAVLDKLLGMEVIQDRPNLVSDISDAKRLLSDAEFKKTIERLIPLQKEILAEAPLYEAKTKKMKQDSKEFIKGLQEEGKAKEAKADAEAEAEAKAKAIKDATFTDQTPAERLAVLHSKHAELRDAIRRMDNEHKLTTLEPAEKKILTELKKFMTKFDNAKGDAEAEAAAGSFPKSIDLNNLNDLSSGWDYVSKNFFNSIDMTDADIEDKLAHNQKYFMQKVKAGERYLGPKLDTLKAVREAQLDFADNIKNELVTDDGGKAMEAHRKAYEASKLEAVNAQEAKDKILSDNKTLDAKIISYENTPKTLEEARAYKAEFEKTLDDMKKEERV